MLKTLDVLIILRFFFFVAHILIKQIRNRIVDFSNNANIVKSNISLIREDVATILYIIQEFYSNTNWVELFGNRIYNDFGNSYYSNTHLLNSSKLNVYMYLYRCFTVSYIPLLNYQAKNWRITMCDIFSRRGNLSNEIKLMHLW